jgi:hypothetical protein
MDFKIKGWSFVASRLRYFFTLSICEEILISFERGTRTDILAKRLTTLTFSFTLSLVVLLLDGNEVIGLVFNGRGGLLHGFLCGSESLGCKISSDLFLLLY